MTEMPKSPRAPIEKEARSAAPKARSRSQDSDPAVMARVVSEQQQELTQFDISV